MELKPCKNGNSIIGGRFHVGEYLLYANEESTHVANYLIKDKKEKDKHHCAKYGERLIGFDSINVLKENNVDTGLAWYDQMDFTRHKFGNDVKYHNSKDLITYKHYVISPDPKDNISLPEFQAFVHDYVEHWFGDYECAMAYHADNANEIMHCHLIVNNTNLKTGGRVSSYLSNKVVNKMQEDLQLRALEVGYHAFDENGDSLTKEEMQQRGTRVTSSKYESQRIKRAKAATKSDNKQRSTPAHSFKPKRGSKRNFETKTERALKEKGITPWKEEIRQRVLLALEVSATEREFLLACRNLGVNVTLAKSKTKGYNKPEYIFHHPEQKAEHDARQVRGMKLGDMFSRRNLDRGFELSFVVITQATKDIHKAYPVPPDAKVRHNIIDNLQMVGIQVDGVSFDEITAMLNYNDKHHISSYADYKKIGSKEAKEMLKIARAVKTFEVRSSKQENAINNDMAFIQNYIAELNKKGYGGNVGGKAETNITVTEENSDQNRGNELEKGRRK